MALTEKVTFLLNVDAKGAVNEFQKVERAADKNLGKAEARIDKLGAGFTKVGAGMIGAAGLAGAALASTIGPASDLNEAINVVGLTFGESADEIEAWADTAADSIGQSKRQALEGASAIGGLLKNVGFLEEEAAELSPQLVTLASDMASAFNTDPVEALEAIRAGLAGESEPLKKYNVFVNEAAKKTKALELGLYDGVGALDEHAKASATLALIQEQTADVQGDFANTADGAANAQRRFAAQLEDARAEIGQAVLPIFENLLGVLNDVFGAFNSLDDGTKKLIGQIAVLGTGTLGAAGSVALIAGKAIQARDSFQGMGKAAKGATLAAGGLAAALGAGIIVMQDFKRRAAEAEAQADSMRDALNSAADDTTGVVNRIRALAEESGEFRDVIAELNGDELVAFAGALADGEMSTRDLRDMLEQFGVSAFDAQLLVRKLAQDIEIAREANDVLANSFQESDGAVRAAAISANNFEKRVAAAAEATAAAADEMPEFSAKVINASDAAETLSDQLSDVNNALSTMFGGLQSAAEREADFEEAVAEAAKTLAANGAELAANGAELDATTEKGRENIDARGRVISAIEDEIAAMIDNNATVDEVVAKAEEMIGRFEEVAGEAGATGDEIGIYTGILEDVPEMVATELELQGYDTAINQIRTMEEWINRIPDRKEVQVALEWAGAPGAPSSVPPAAATPDTGGGFNLGPEFTAVAENQSGTLRSSAQSGSAGSGFLGTVATTVMLDSRVLAEAVADYSQQSGGLPLKVRAAG